MACSNPIKLYPENIRQSLKKSHVDYKMLAYERSFGNYDYFEVPCRYCLNCRVDRQNEFVDRCEYEYINYGCGAFVTFTYDDVHLFNNSFIDSKTGKTVATINKKEVKDFLNRLNKLVHIESNKLKKKGLPDTLCRSDYRYVCTHEYGDSFNRPHVHCLFFGLDFAFCERLFWRAWNYKGSIEVGAIKNGGIAYVTKYISSQTYGIDDFYKYTYHHLERPSSSHSLGLGEGLYKSQLKYIKEHDGCYHWHGVDRPVPQYYKNKFRIISDLDSDKMAKRYKAKCENIKNLYDHRITSFKDFKQFSLNKAIQRQQNLEIKLRQQGKQIYNSDLTAIEKSDIRNGFDSRLNPIHDRSITTVINNRGEKFLHYKKDYISLPLTNSKCMKYFHTDYNSLARQFGYKTIDSLFGLPEVPF